MKAILKSIAEGTQTSAERHTCVLMFSDAETSENSDLSPLAKRLTNASIAAGNTDYQMTIDLAQLYGSDPTCKAADGVTYDPVKGLAKFRSEFTLGADFSGLNLFVIPLTEITGGKVASVKVADSGRIFTAYRRAYYCSREEAVKLCANAFAASVASGAFIVENEKPQPTTAEKLAALAPIAE